VTALMSSTPRVSTRSGGGHRAGIGPLERSTGWAVDRTGATKRQLDYWGRGGLLGEDHHALGSGKRRRYSDADLEVIVALRHLAALGATEEWLHAGSGAVRVRRVAPGEWLTVTLDGVVDRSHRPFMHGRHPAWTVPLTAFDQGRPL